MKLENRNLKFGLIKKPKYETKKIKFVFLEKVSQNHKKNKFTPSQRQFLTSGIIVSNFFFSLRTLEIIFICDSSLGWFNATIVRIL